MHQVPDKHLHRHNLPFAIPYVCVPVYLQALSRLTRVVPAVFSAVIDICGPAAILEAVGGAGARVQQHLLTALAMALLAAKTQTHRITQSQVCAHRH